MKTVNIHEAKTNLSQLLKRVESGEEVVVSRAGKPVARILPVQNVSEKRIPGSAKGKIFIEDGFYEPLPESILKDFEG